MRATLPYLSPTIVGIIELLWHTGARPCEVLSLCPRDIDKTDSACWTARLAEHKTANKGRLREIMFSRDAQAVLQRFLDRVSRLPEGLLIFSPKRAMEELRLDRRAARETPLWPSHVANVGT